MGFCVGGAWGVRNDFPYWSLRLVLLPHLHQVECGGGAPPSRPARGRRHLPDVSYSPFSVCDRSRSRSSVCDGHELLSRGEDTGTPAFCLGTAGGCGRAPPTTSASGRWGPPGWLRRRSLRRRRRPPGATSARSRGWRPPPRPPPRGAGPAAAAAAVASARVFVRSRAIF
jgi:hypothetical protein